MKNLITITIILALNLIFNESAKGQNCGFSSNENFEAVTSDNSSMSMNIRLYFVLIRKTDGSGDIQENLIQGLLDKLEIYYTIPHGISFTNMCVRYIDKDEYYDNTQELLSDLQEIRKTTTSSDGITIYLVKHPTPTVAGAAETEGGTNLWVQYSLDGKDLAHEIGHVLDLRHTFIDNDLECVNGVGHCMLYGDKICDTEVDPYKGNQPYCNASIFCKWDQGFLELNPNICKDPCGDYYRTDVTNLMSYFADCRTNFTHGQANRMKEAYLFHIGGNNWDVNLQPSNIQSNTLISSPTYFGGDVTIKSGYTLTVQSTIYMSSQSKIIIEPGATLLLNGGKLTLGNIKNLCQNRSSNLFWYGIELQTSSNGLPPRFISTSNNVIEFSEFGIHVSKVDVGGSYYLHCNGTTFKNNKHSIYILRNRVFASGPSFVTNSLFILDSKFPLTKYYNQVKIDNSNLTIISTFFENPRKFMPFDDESYSINSMNTQLVLNNCKFQNGVFYGAQISNFLSTKTCSFKYCDFDKLQKGINIKAGVNNFILTNNNFNNLEIFGIQVDQCTGYIIRHNAFNNSQQIKPGYIGLIIMQSGIASNLVDNNNFHSIFGTGSSAIKTIGVNGENFSGLQFRCNNITYCQQDYLFEGSLCSKQGENTNAAGNAAFMGEKIKYDTKNLSHKFDYFHRNIINETPENNFNINKFQVANLNCNFYNTGNGTGTGSNPLPLPFDQYSLFMNTLNGDLGNYNSLINGGDTEIMINLINNYIAANNVQSLFEILDSYSPWLDFKVIFAAFSRGNLLSESEKYLLCLHNLDNFNYPNFEISLRENFNNIDSILIDSLNHAIKVINSRTLLESKIAEEVLNTNVLTNNELCLIKIDSVSNRDSLKIWLSRLNNYSGNRELIEYYTEMNLFDSATHLSNSINSNINYSALERLDNNNLNDLVNYMSSVYQSGRYEGNFNLEEKDSLETLSINNNSITASEILSALNFYNFESNETQNLAQENQIFNAELPNDAVRKPLIDNESYLVFPNPSTNDLTIINKTKRQSLNTCKIYDLNGVVCTKSFTFIDYYKIDVSKLLAGIYILSIEDSKGNLIYKRIQVIH